MAQPAQDFKTLFEQSIKNLEIKEGDVLKGRVIAVRRDLVMVDVGFKSEGWITSEEFRDFDGQIKVNVGDEIDVMVEELEDADGLIGLSKERADALRSWDKVAEIHDNDGEIEGVVVNKIKGGMSVNLGGIKAFLPGSQIDLKPVKSLDKLIGRKYKFKILKLNQAKGNIVLSRRTILEKERASLKKDLLGNLKEGQVVQGVVKNITDYGVFVDLGGIDGLLHITDMTWGRISHPSEILKVGDEIEVAVLKFESDSEKVSLGLKQLKPDPWKECDQNYVRGQIVIGKAVNVTEYGVFVELGDGIEGLVHISELTWKKNVKHPSKIVNVGDEIKAQVLEVDPENRRISLGVKQLEANPWKSLSEKYKEGSKIKGVVRNITDFGIFVGVEGEEVDGLVHISDLTWDRSLKHPSDIYKKGDEVEAVVLSVDTSAERFALGIKQLQDNPLRALEEKFGPKKIVTGTISEVEDKALTITFEGSDIVGIVPANEAQASSKAKLKEIFKVGDEISAVSKKLELDKKQVTLSIKQLERVQEKQNMKEFLAEQGDASVSLGDVLKAKE